MNLKRSLFIKLGGMTAIGSIAAIPAMLSSCATGASSALCSGPGWDIEQRIKELGLEFPSVPDAVGIYKPILIMDNKLYVSGLGPDLPAGVETDLPNNGTQVIGRVGEDLTLEEGREAARFVALTTLAVIKKHFGDLNKICRLVKTLGLVNCTSDFRRHPAVINGFSRLMADIWGDEHGIGVRTSFGAGSLPENIPVEIECVFELKS
jgi:enamine deaminase RidA (YjgF/YER057c/UK114 family)